MRKRDIHGGAGRWCLKFRMRFVQGFIAFFAFWRQKCTNYARIYRVPESPPSFCARIYTIFCTRLGPGRHGSRAASSRPPGAHLACQNVNISLGKFIFSPFVIAKCHYYIRKMYIFSISILQNVNIT